MLRLLAAISLIIATLASAQGEESDTRQGCISPTFRTLHIRHADDMWAPPVINLNNNSERIAVSFDELADEHRYLRYSLTHCDAEWMSEGLVDSEFLDSFNEGTVDNYEYSQATVVHYVHYAITIPNNQIRITQPGNYLLRVYDERDPDNTLVQARFGAADFSATVRATVSSRTDIDSNKSHQQLDISVDTRHVNVEDPFNDI
ncbi:type IX secretion system plug protein domain-containing protein, partial [uncultured Duncaniella sp.]